VEHGVEAEDRGHQDTRASAISRDDERPST
jgi:hypothetical protein